MNHSLSGIDTLLWGEIARDHWILHHQHSLLLPRMNCRCSHSKSTTLMNHLARELDDSCCSPAPKQRKREILRDLCQNECFDDCTSFICNRFGASSWALSKIAAPDAFSVSDHRSDGDRLRWFLLCLMLPERAFFERRRPDCGWEENTCPGDNRSRIDCGVVDVDGGNARLCTRVDDGAVGDDSNCVSLSV